MGSGNLAVTEPQPISEKKYQRGGLRLVKLVCPAITPGLLLQCSRTRSLQEIDPTNWTGKNSCLSLGWLRLVDL